MACVSHYFIFGFSQFHWLLACFTLVLLPQSKYLLCYELLKLSALLSGMSFPFTRYYEKCNCSQIPWQNEGISSPKEFISYLLNLKTGGNKTRRKYWRRLSMLSNVHLFVFIMKFLERNCTQLLFVSRYLRTYLKRGFGFMINYSDIRWEYDECLNQTKDWPGERDT